MDRSAADPRVRSTRSAARRPPEGNPPLATPPTNPPRPPGPTGLPQPTDPPAAPRPHGDRTGPIPLNAFQQVIRSWERVHPYNAGQVMEIRPAAATTGGASRGFGPAAVAAGWAAALVELRLGRVEVRPISYRHVGLNGEAARYPLRVLPAGTPLDAFFAAEMNRPFDDAGEPPFRPFLMPDPAAGTWHLGVVYQHWVADSVAVRHLLRRWLEELFPAAMAVATAAAAAGPADRRPVRHAGIGYLGLLGTAPAALTPVQQVLSVIRRHQRYRKVRKVRTAGAADYPVGVVLAEGAGLVPRLLAAARARRAKVNDLFLAAAARACDGRVPTQAHGRRPDLALASIVDLRPFARGALDDRFGLFLGFAEVVCRPADLRDPARLVATVVGQNRTHRHHGIWPASVGFLAAALIARPLVPARKVYHFFRKEAPLTAGVSNVNLNPTWAGRLAAGGDKGDGAGGAGGGGLLVRYRRVSPTGPIAPVVFSLTTLGDDLQVSLTHRAALLSTEQARELAAAFLAELAALAGR